MVIHPYNEHFTFHLHPDLSENLGLTMVNALVQLWRSHEYGVLAASTPSERVWVVGLVRGGESD